MKYPPPPPPEGWSGGILPQKILKFQVLGNAIFPIVGLSLVMNLLHLRLTYLLYIFTSSCLKLF